jgi:hypothetical protein
MKAAAELGAKLRRPNYLTKRFIDLIFLFTTAEQPQWG